MKDEFELSDLEEEIQKLINEQMKSIDDHLESIKHNLIDKLKEISQIADRVNLILSLQQKEYPSARDILKNNLNDARSHLENLINIEGITNNSIGNLLTDKLPYSREGQIPFIHNEVKRNYRSFQNDRERQVLKQVATQIHLAFKSRGIGSLTEVQIMHLSFDNCHNLFITANETTATKHIAETIKADNFENFLITPYAPSADTKNEGAIRSKRYAAKLKSRIFAENNNAIGQGADSENFNIIKDILKNKHIQPIELDYEETKNFNKASADSLNDAMIKNGNIYLIHIKNHPTPERHAEEFLCDIFEYAKQFQSPLYSCIAGKKRPCMGCSGRMQAVNVSSYGKFPGRFWLNTIEIQPDNVALETAKLLLEKPAHVSTCKDNITKITEYDTGSDSDEEFEKKLKY